MNVSAFVPRSVRQKTKVPKVGYERTKQNKCTTYKKTDNESTPLEEASVKQRCLEQRWPAPEEPVCVVCGRYGEYICDQTDEDICSLECKRLHLQPQNTEVQLTETNSLIKEEFDEEISTVDCESFDSYFMQHSRFIPLSGHHCMTEGRSKNLREKLEVRVRGNKISGLMVQFKDYLSSQQLLQNLLTNKYIRPTPVQMQVVPLALHGRDVLVSATTGSGKTASFLLPIIQRIFQCVGTLPRSHAFCKSPIALIVAPTRELCLQIEEQTKQLCASLNNMRTAVIIGGCPIPHQLHRLSGNIQVVVGTPGRMIELLEKHEHVFNVDHVKMVVFDEVDVMMHLGFLSQVQSITAAIPGQPQYLLFSATIPPPIEKIAKDLLRDTVYVSVGVSGQPDKDVKQLVLWVEETSKKKRLFSIIEDGRHFLPPVLVFVDSKLGADMLCDAIVAKCDLHCASIHSDKTQTERTEVLQQFLGGTYDVLISTNVMARGLHLANVKQVVIFDMPASVDEYVHQVGRAGGMCTRGYSIAFINNSSKHIFSDFKDLFAATGNKLPDEVSNSPYLLSSLQRKRKKLHRSQHTESRELDKETNHQNLFEILTKHGRR